MLTSPFQRSPVIALESIADSRVFPVTPSYAAYRMAIFPIHGEIFIPGTAPGDFLESAVSR